MKTYLAICKYYRYVGKENIRHQKDNIVVFKTEELARDFIKSIYENFIKENKDYILSTDTVSVDKYGCPYIINMKNKDQYILFFKAKDIIEDEDSKEYKREKMHLEVILNAEVQNRNKPSENKDEVKPGLVFFSNEKVNNKED